MKNTFRYRVKYTLTGALLCASVLLSSCVKEGSQDCNNKLTFLYDYNMDRVCKFSAQVRYFSIFAFDSQTGLFVDEFQVQGDPFASGFTMDVPMSLYGKNHDLIVWAGLHEESCGCPRLEKGSSTKEDLKVQVQGYEDRFVDTDLEPLWHGSIDKVYFDELTEKTETIELMKDTKTFRILLDFQEGLESVDSPYDPEELEVGVYSPDGWMAFDNSVLDDPARSIHYSPYTGFRDSKNLVYELNTLRLMDDRDAKLVIREKSTGKVIYNLNDMNYYLDLLRLDEHQWVRSLQEYLDRQDSYKFLITLRDQGTTEEGWLSVKVSINDWVLREHSVGG